MRQVRYSVASSLDGYIAAPNGEFDWIVKDPDIDFAEISSRFDTLLIGARTFDLMVRHGQSAVPGMKMFVFSQGGALFRTLLEAGLVDAVEVAIVPVLLGAGIPLLPPPSAQTKLKLTEHKVCKSGIVSLAYSIA